MSIYSTPKQTNGALQFSKSVGIILQQHQYKALPCLQAAPLVISLLLVSALWTFMIQSKMHGPLLNLADQSGALQPRRCRHWHYLREARILVCRVNLCAFQSVAICLLDFVGL